MSTNWPRAVPSVLTAHRFSGSQSAYSLGARSLQAFVQLTEFERPLDRLKAGTALTEKDLEN